jgi:hypothetical protein
MKKLVFGVLTAIMLVACSSAEVDSVTSAAASEYVKLLDAHDKAVQEWNDAKIASERQSATNDWIRAEVDFQAGLAKIHFPASAQNDVEKLQQASRDMESILVLINNVGLAGQPAVQAEFRRSTDEWNAADRALRRDLHLPEPST